MNTQEPKDYHSVLTDLIRKQMLILGPTFPIKQARLIKGLKIADNGTVLETSIDPKIILNEFISQSLNVSETLVELSMMPLIHATLGNNYGEELFANDKKPPNELPENEHEQSRL